MSPSIGVHSGLRSPLSFFDNVFVTYYRGVRYPTLLPCLVALAFEDSDGLGIWAR